jgi:hypothetical protein
VSEEHHLSRKKAKRSEDDFASYAWRLIGTLGTAAGWLDLTAGRLRFSTAAEAVFDVPLAEVTDIIWPWYYFGGGVKLSVEGTQYRFSFVLPNGADYPTARLAAEAGDAGALAIVWQKADDIGAGRDVGKEWRRRLDAAAPPAGPDGGPGSEPAGG